MSINKVLYNIDQRSETTDEEKKTARNNIGAATKVYAVNFLVGNQFSITSNDISRGYAEIVQNLVLPSGLNYSVSTDLYNVTCSRGAEGYSISAFVSRISVQLLDSGDTPLCTIFDSTQLVENINRRWYGNYFGFAYPPKKLRIRFYLNQDAAAGDKITPTSSTVFIPYGE